jgi:Na+/melibiose symporter-like transporter
VLIDAAETAILPSALPKSLLGDVNGWRSSAQEGMKLVAPLAGAGLYAWRGPLPVVLIGAAMPLLTATCYALLRVPYAGAGAGREEQVGDGEVRVGSAREGEGGGLAADGGQARGMAGVGGREAEMDCRRSNAKAGWRGPRAAGSAGAGEVEGGSAWAETAVDGKRERATTGRGGEEVRAGLRALFGNSAVRVPVLVAAAAIGLSGLTNAAVISRVVHGLGLPATHLGFLSTAQGAGSIISGLVVGRLLARFGTAMTAGLGSVLFGVGCVTWSLPWWPSMIVGSVLAGLGLVWALIAAVTAVQTGTPDRLLGRVAATSNTVMFGPVAVAIPVGAAAVHLGAGVVLLVAAGLAVVTALLFSGPRR